MTAKAPAKVSTASLDSGFGIDVIDRGAALNAIRVPTDHGLVNVVLGYATAADAAADPYYLGSTVGRFANRIAGARFELDGRVHELEANEPATGNCLHGGSAGLAFVAWDLVESPKSGSVVCRCQSPDGAGGFPGNLDVIVTYRLESPSTLRITYEAVSDKDTVLSLTNHAYFNLDGDGRNVDDHRIRIAADSYTPFDDRQIPVGDVVPVDGTILDLRAETRVGSARFDHNFVLDDSGIAATLVSPRSGIRLEVSTTMPGLQVYTGDSLGPPFAPRAGLCLETQSFPDAPNQPEFPSATLRAGATYRSETVLRFLAETPGQP